MLLKLFRRRGPSLSKKQENIEVLQQEQDCYWSKIVADKHLSGFFD